MKRKMLKKLDAFEIVCFVVIMIYVISIIYVLLFGLVNSLKDYRDYYRGNVFGWPSGKYDKEGSFLGLQFVNYAQMFNDFYCRIKPIGGAPRNVYPLEMMFNSIVYSVAVSITTIASQVVVAYAVSKYSFKLRNTIFNMAIIVMTIPIIGSLASQIRIMTSLGLSNSIIGVCIMKASYTGMHFLIFYASFKGISWSYAEAAQIDGAGHFYTFLRIMLPMASSTIMAVFILQFISNFNDYYTPMIFLPLKPTISYGLYQYQSNVASNTSPPLKLAASLFSCIPVFILFMIFRNKIMGNLSIGGLKG